MENSALRTIGRSYYFSTCARKIEPGYGTNRQLSGQLFGHVKVTIRAQCHPSVARTFESAITAHNCSGKVMVPERIRVVWVIRLLQA